MGEVVRLTREHQDSVSAFLATSPIENVLVMDRILEDGLPGKPYQEFVGYREAGQWLGIMYFSGDISLFAPEERAIRPLAEYALHRTPLVPRIIARKETVDRFWEIFGTIKLPLLFDRRQLVYGMSLADLKAPPEPALRLARLDEAHAVARLASAMSFEEIMLDPYKDYPASYLRLVEQRIRLERYWVLEDDGQIKFQVHLNGVTAFAGQVTGVYTPPAFRHQGYAGRGMGEFCRQVLERVPQLCLFVNDFNLPAIRLYEKLGFQPLMEYRAIFLDGRRV
ncbi:MAG: GCN5-related N-acetyltransferase [Cyanobacteria bacterium RYN_339]|nr:GCN5-related N-acetyltransferase [Cyanobacteria bacterium RYN_339]